MSTRLGLESLESKCWWERWSWWCTAGWWSWWSLSWLLHLLDTALLPGVVPYPELLGRLATLHLLPSPDLSLPPAPACPEPVDQNPALDTLGESRGLTPALLGEWQRARMGLVCTIMLFR